METLKSRILKLLTYDDGDTSKAEKFVSIFMLVLITTNVAMVILETIRGLPQHLLRAMSIFEAVSIIIFTAEYFLRLWTADLLYPTLPKSKARIKYIFSFLAIVDLLAILPFYLPFLLPFDLRSLRAIRMIRLIRIFKVNRFTKSIDLIGSVLRNKASALISSLFIMLILLTISATAMYNVEYSAQPDKFVSVLSGFWWAISMLTTVGYGDIYPITSLGKFLSGIISVIGIGIVALPTSILSAGFLEELSKKTNPKICPHCGKQLEP